MMLIESVRGVWVKGGGGGGCGQETEKKGQRAIYGLTKHAVTTAKKETP